MRLASVEVFVGLFCGCFPPQILSIKSKYFKVLVALYLCVGDPAVAASGESGGDAKRAAAV